MQLMAGAGPAAGNTPAQEQAIHLQQLLFKDYAGGAGSNLR